MLRIIRTVLAVLSLAAMLFVFADFTGAAAGWLGFLPKLQLVPALLALNFVALGVLLVLTLVFGRVYCSVICPLGISQDVVSRLRIWLAPKKKRKLGVYKTTKEHRKLRIGFLVVFLILAVLGLTGLLAMSYAGLLEPYSIFGRAAGQFVAPAWREAAVHIGDAAAPAYWLFDGVPAPGAFSWLLASIAAAQVLIIAILAWRGGRTYCNSICPVGTILGWMSKFSLFKIHIDENKCVSCGKCARHCKAGCIDPKSHSVDYTRCVACMDCIGKCSTNAIAYRIPKRKEAEPVADNTGRRSFLIGAGIAAGALAANAADKVTDGGLAPIKAKKSHELATPLVPAGAISIKHLRSHCTACQLCISACPNGVLKPSMSLDGFMQPTLVFTQGYCRPECTACADVCPAGAIEPIDVATKAVTKIGTATVDAWLCLSAKGESCGKCAKLCPAQAITMVRVDGHLRPVVDESRCIGCGSCEYHCPVGTAGQFSADHAAIYVEGIEKHHSI